MFVAIGFRVGCGHPRRAALWSTLLLVAATAAALGAGGCGNSRHKRTPRVASTSLPGIDTSLPSTSERGTITTSAIPAGQRDRGDGDADNPGDIDGNGDVDGEDGDSDYPVPDSYKLPDADDRATFAYGHAPSATQRKAISLTVKRYYAAAAVEEGAAACALLSPNLARSIPEDYGQGAGPAYLRGGKTCAGVMSMLFKHSHKELTQVIDVIDVRVNRTDAQVVLSSPSLRAGSILLTRLGSAWRMRELLDVPLL
jgi:hypothetical protein